MTRRLGRRSTRSLIAAVPAAMTLSLLVACGSDGGGDQSGGSDESSDAATANQSPTASGGESTGESDGGSSAPTPRVQSTIAEGLAVPWGLDFLPDERAVVTERDSRRVLLVDAEGRVDEAGTIEAAAPEGEAGLLGVAVSPTFDQDRLLYFYVTTQTDNRVVKAPLRNGTLGEPTPILTDIPRGFIHDGGRIAFGPDEHLYVATGETGEQSLAQDPDSLAGKILRITVDGDVPSDNPDPDSPVWTSGHRNVQGLAFDDEGRLWASEFGQDTWDELNLIEKGNNYGWPEVEGRGENSDFTDPQQVWPTSEASPSGLTWYDGQLWMAALMGERLWRVTAEGDSTRAPQAFFVGAYGRLRTVVPAPDGSLWVTTSNRDGRNSSPDPSDDRILRVVV